MNSESETELPQEPDSSHTPLFQRGDAPLIALLLGLPLFLSVPVFGTPLHGPALELLGPDGGATSLATVSEIIRHYPHAPLTWGLIAAVWQLAPGILAQQLIAPIIHGIGAVLLFLTATQLAAVVWPSQSPATGRRIPLGRAALAALAALYAANDIVMMATVYPLMLPVPFGGALAMAALLCWTLAMRRPAQWYWPALGILLYAGACGANLPTVLLPLAGLAIAYRVRANPMVALWTMGPPMLLTAIILAVILGEGAGAHQPLWEAVSPFLIVPIRGLFGGSMLSERFGAPSPVPVALLATIPLMLAAIMALMLIPEKGVLRGGVIQFACGIVFAGLAIGFAILTWSKAAMVTDPEAIWMQESKQANNLESRAFAVKHLMEYVLGDAGSMEDASLRSARLEAAHAELNALLQEYPRHADSLVLAARAALLEGKVAEAAPLLQRALAADPFSAEAARHAALVAALTAPQPSNLDEARRVVAACRRAEVRGVLPVEAGVAYAAALGMLGDYDLALHQINELPPAMRGRAGALVDQLRTGARIADTSMQQFNQAANADPAGSARFVAEAQSALARKDFIKAFYRLERLLAREPENTRAFELMGMTLAGMGDGAAFITQWGDAPERDPETWGRVVAAAASTGATETAIAYADHAAQRFGPSWAALQSARALMAVGRFDEALPKLDLAREDPVYAGAAWVTLAELHMRKGDRNAATMAINNAAAAGVSEEALAPLRQALGQ